MTVPSESGCIEASVSLSVDDKTRHWFYARQRTEEERAGSIHKTEFGGGSVNRTVKVNNGRNQDLTLDETSFELVDCPTALSTKDFYAMQDGEDELREKYYEEVKKFVKNKMGCDKVVCLHTLVRNADGNNMEGGGVQGYAGGGPHTDADAVTADEVALTSLQDGKKYMRYSYLNIWRNISEEPIENDHLAMLDERSTVKPDDYLSRDVSGFGYEVSQYGLNARHASNHKWYYFPHMCKNEAILFKLMDSDWTKNGRICFHMSVNDPLVQEKKSRESIEMRMVCYWEKAGVDSMPNKENMSADLIQRPFEIANTVGNINNASAWELSKALFWRVLGYGGATATKASPYSGNPEDYLEKFITVVNTYPSWPSFATKWVKSQMDKGLDKGIQQITVELVNDQMGFQKTKHFETSEKKEISDLLLSNEKYMEAAKKHFGSVI
uniref:Uncharacterized protein n=1 Tax=Helicotheca tamesis TaxID=374047 RepID=A0A7S2HHY3_9STRA